MPWLETGWTRRKIKIVENLTVSDYQMKLIIHKSGLGPDTYTDVYLGDHCRDDFADLRFTGPNQTTPLSYWIESIVSGVATVWIKIPTLTPTNNIYIYYDNPAITSPASSGMDTFEFFDDFSALNLNKWTVGGSSWSGSSGYLQASNPASEGWIYATGLNIDNLAVDYNLYTGRSAIPYILMNYQSYSNFYHCIGTTNYEDCGNHLNTGILLGSKYNGTWNYDYTIFTNVVSEATNTWIKRSLTSRFDGTNRILELRNPTTNSVLATNTFTNRFNNGTIGFRVHDSLNPQQMSEILLKKGFELSIGFLHQSEGSNRYWNMLAYDFVEPFRLQNVLMILEFVNMRLQNQHLVYQEQKN